MSSRIKQCKPRIAGEARIKYDEKKITVARLREVINSTGYKAVEERSTARASARRGKRRSS